MEIAAIPPTTPPAMAPAFEPPVAVGVGVGVGGDVKPWVEDVSVDPVGFGEVRVAPVPVPVVGEPEVPIRAPGPISGVSPVAIDVLAFQLFSRVTSRRAQAGTYVPAGTGLGKLEGGSVFVQLYVYSDHVIHGCNWHASHALMREYATVLHLHKLLSSTPLGPV